MKNFKSLILYFWRLFLLEYLGIGGNCVVLHTKFWKKNSTRTLPTNNYLNFIHVVTNIIAWTIFFVAYYCKIEHENGHCVWIMRKNVMNYTSIVKHPCIFQWSWYFKIMWDGRWDRVHGVSEFFTRRMYCSRFSWELLLITLETIENTCTSTFAWQKTVTVLWTTTF